MEKETGWDYRDAASSRTWAPAEDREARYEHAGMVFGDLGGVHLFEWRACPDRPSAHRFDCA
ncbi:hypothetical protein [Streptomyces sp. NPDC047525]|uniref:hypothetical protein n=1 Tax=Streptomyces sp. NPDC047525 TaxID=3155264 RepID=UPI00340601E3